MIKRTVIGFLLLSSLFFISSYPSISAAQTFADVPSSYRAYDEIMYLAQGKIVSGNKGYYQPGREVTRAEAAVMLWTSLGIRWQ